MPFSKARDHEIAVTIDIDGVRFGRMIRLDRADLSTPGGILRQNRIVDTLGRITADTIKLTLGRQGEPAFRDYYVEPEPPESEMG